MLRNRHALLVTTVLALTTLACADAPTAPVPDVDTRIGFSNGAVIDGGTVTVPFPPNPNVTIFVAAPCLGLSTPLVMAGTWVIRFSTLETAAGRSHGTEHIDYSGVAITSNGLTWQPAANAHEIIMLNLGSSGAANLTHQFQARYYSQDGLPDLMVYHSYKVVIRADGTLVRDQFVGFSADCLGN